MSNVLTIESLQTFKKKKKPINQKQIPSQTPKQTIYWENLQ